MTQTMTDKMNEIMDKAYEFSDYPKRINDLIVRTCGLSDDEVWALRVFSELMMNGDHNSYERAFTYAVVSDMDITGYPLGLVGRLMEGALGDANHIDVHCVPVWDWLCKWKPSDMAHDEKTTDDTLKQWFSIEVEERDYNEYISMLYRAVQNRYMVMRLNWMDDRNI